MDRGKVPKVACLMVHIGKAPFFYCASTSARGQSLFAIPEHRGVSRPYTYVAVTKAEGNPDMSVQMNVFQQPLKEVQINSSVIQRNMLYFER